MDDVSYKHSLGVETTLAAVYNVNIMGGIYQYTGNF